MILFDDNWKILIHYIINKSYLTEVKDVELGFVENYFYHIITFSCKITKCPNICSLYQNVLPCVIYAHNRQEPQN